MDGLLNDRDNEMLYQENVLEVKCSKMGHILPYNSKNMMTEIDMYTLHYISAEYTTIYKRQALFAVSVFTTKPVFVNTVFTVKPVFVNIVAPMLFSFGDFKI